MYETGLNYGKLDVIEEKRLLCIRVSVIVSRIKSIKIHKNADVIREINR